MVQLVQSAGSPEGPAGLELAQRLISCDDDTRWRQIESLLLDRSLFKSVQTLNGLLASQDHRDLGIRALRSIGFDA